MVEYSKSQNKLMQRNSSVELLRILAMLFIVISHSSVHGGFPINTSQLPFNNILLEWMVLGNLGVDLFWLISGYFLCEKENTVKSVGKLHTQVLFYSFLGLFVYLCFNTNITLMAIIKTCCPALFGVYWFFTVYIIFLFFAPYVNLLIKNLSRKQHLSFMVMMFVIWSLIPSFIFVNTYATELSQFLMFYIMGAYIKKYPSNILSKKHISNMLIVGSFTCLFSANIIFHLLGIYIPRVTPYGGIFYYRNSVLIVLCAIGLFSRFIYMKPFYNKYINMVGGCTFGVYLLHENFLMKNILWQDWFHNHIYYNSVTLVVHLMGSVLLVFVTGVIVDFFRQKYIDKSFLSFYNKMLNRIVCTIKHRVTREI